MKIRKAESRDKKAISELYYQLYPKHKGPKKIIPIEVLEAKSLLFLAEEDEKDVGFIWGTFINYGISKYGYIDELFVKKEFRRKGIATSLVKTILEEFRKLKAWTVFVSTSEENRWVKTFYIKYGFKLCKGPWLYKEIKEDKNI